MPITTRLCAFCAILSVLLPGPRAAGQGPAAVKDPNDWGPTWLPPRAYTSYFYFLACDRTARAIAHRGEHAAERLGRMRDDILGVVEADGTWLDFESIGKPYGTAMALHVLYLERQARDRDRPAR